jgi:hypothetical protein
VRLTKPQEDMLAGAREDERRRILASRADWTQKRSTEGLAKRAAEVARGNGAKS